MTDSFSFPGDSFILIGKVVKAHGLKGEIKINPLSGQPGNFKDYQALILVDANGQLSSPYLIDRIKVSGKTAIVKLKGLNGRNQAEQVCSMGVLVDKTELPKLGDDEFYYHELIGLTVQTVEGEVLGQIENIFFNGAQEIMEIQGTGKHYLVPVLQELIVTHDQKKIIIAPPPGLLDIN